MSGFNVEPEPDFIKLENAPLIDPMIGGYLFIEEETHLGIDNPNIPIESTGNNANDRQEIPHEEETISNDCPAIDIQSEFESNNDNNELRQVEVRYKGRETRTFVIRKKRSCQKRQKLKTEDQIRAENRINSRNCVQRNKQEVETCKMEIEFREKQLSQEEKEATDEFNFKGAAVHAEDILKLARMYDPQGINNENFREIVHRVQDAHIACEIHKSEYSQVIDNNGNYPTKTEEEIVQYEARLREIDTRVCHTQKDRNNRNSQRSRTKDKLERLKLHQRIETLRSNIEQAKKRKERYSECNNFLKKAIYDEVACVDRLLVHYYARSPADGSLDKHRWEQARTFFGFTFRLP
ncbi:unnamed protein product [Caenorhabditis auriculariae]|uniref:BZIP domain-containing protein n=1 Tax=Caenorhabditis auriculariae TaxID=2777116 RepID=A0A8S1HIB7_9PELO|nr:unnamed protein product [Caenorhabditis auriculariae]